MVQYKLLTRIWISDVDLHSLYDIRSINYISVQTDTDFGLDLSLVSSLICKLY